MGGKSGPNLPNTMDYWRTAGMQTDAARQLMQEQTRANRPTQITPGGTSRWEQGPGGEWTQTIELAEPQQAALEAQQRTSQARSELGESMMGRAAQELGGEMGWEAMAANEVGTGQQARDAAEQALFERTTSRLDPMWEQRRGAMETKLWQQGLRPGDAAYDTAMANLGREQTDAYQTAMREAIIGGGQEATRQFGMDMARRQQAIAESLRRRGATLNEINALMTGQQVGGPNLPGFTSAGRVAAPDLMGGLQASAQSDIDRYNAQQMRQQSMGAGIGALGQAAFAFSDRRLKTHIRRVGSTLGGQPIYQYRIFGRDSIGVMADESPPEAVYLHESGFYMVDYSRIR